ncbi:MAG: hypothetical protein AAF693_15245 [Bacteroidota bacterium]
MEKRFWTAEDYDKVIREIHFNTPEGQTFPEIDDPETSDIFRKLIDTENFKAVLTDSELGVQHRSKVAEDFFQEYRDLVDAYQVIDRKDFYVYDKELIEIMKFGLELQILYFDLGNKNIINNADDPESTSIKDLLRSNENVIFKNFNNYLEFVNKENSFSLDAIQSFKSGIDVYFPQLITTFPKGQKSIIKNKAELMLKKSQNGEVQKSLHNLISLL